MKKKITIIIFFISWIANAQEYKQITGSVYSKETGEALISASVYYANLVKGTITNGEGEFTIEEIADGDSLVFSYIGYATQKHPFHLVPQKVYLESLTAALPEVMVTPGYADKIVEQIWEKYNRIEKEESQARNKKSSFFYRQITHTHDIYNEFIECFFTGNNTFYIHDLSLQEGRYASIKKDSTVYFSFDNFFYISQVKPFRSKDAGKMNVNTFLQPNFKAIYYVGIDDKIFDENGDIIVLRFQAKKPDNRTNTGKLYVRESDLSIIRFEGTAMENIQFEVNYKEHPDTYPVVESVSCSFYSEKEYKTKNQEIIKYDVRITSILFAIDQPFDNSGKELKRKNTLLDAIHKKKYNPEFWKNNPIVKRTKIDEEVIRAFEATKAFENYNIE